MRKAQRAAASEPSLLQRVAAAETTGKRAVALDGKNTYLVYLLQTSNTLCIWCIWREEESIHRLGVHGVFASRPNTLCKAYLVYFEGCLCVISHLGLSPPSSQKPST